MLSAVIVMYYSYLKYVNFIERILSYSKLSLKENFIFVGAVIHAAGYAQDHQSSHLSPTMVGLMMVVWVIISVNIPGALAGVRRSGPYKVEIEKFTRCDDEGSGTVIWGTKVYRTQDGRRVYNNTVYYGHPIDEDYKTTVELQSFSNGVYRPRYMQHTFKGCEENLKYFQKIYKNLLLSNGEHPQKCPIPAGNYTMESDLNVDMIVNIPTMVYNKYKEIVGFYYKGKKVGCVIAYADVVPKE